MSKRKIDELVYNIVENEIYSKKYELRKLCIEYDRINMYPELLLLFGIDDDYMTDSEASENESENEDEDEYEIVEEPNFKILKDADGFYSIDVDG